MAKKAEIRDVHVERYYPGVLAPAKEFKALAAAENPEFQKFWQSLWKWHLNTFVYDLDEQGATRWEGMLNIRPKAAATLDDRRREILVRINAMLPYTYRRLEQILNALCGAGRYEIDLDYNRYNLAIITNPDETHGIQAIGRTLRPIIPANLTLFVTLAVILAWPIGHQASLRQKVDATHCFWNLGEVRTARRDGEFRRDRSVRRNRISPDTRYKERQAHRAALWMAVDARQTGRMANLRDGAHCRYGGRRREGAHRGGLLQHACTITAVTNGEEGRAMIL